MDKQIQLAFMTIKSQLITEMESFSLQPSIQCEIFSHYYIDMSSVAPKYFQGIITPLHIYIGTVLREWERVMFFLK